MNNLQKQISFSQHIRLKWLQYTADLVLVGNDNGAVNSLLRELLQDKVSVGEKVVCVTKGKVITILMKICNVLDEIEILRDDGIELLKNLPRKNHTVAWSMAVCTGLLLLCLHGTVAHVQRRVPEQYGERETVLRATRCVISSFVDWSVLIGIKEKDIYSQVDTYSIDDLKLTSRLIKDSLHARLNGSAAIKDLLGSTNLFLFCFMHVSAEHLVFMSPRLEMLRYGLDDDLIMLREYGQAAGNGGIK